jgi:sporulation protein YlmC with PRC-barrel domain
MRPAYEIEHLVAAATILGLHGQQDSCEAVLGTTREIYQRYLTDLHSGDIERMDPKKWLDHHIAKTHALTSQGIARQGDGLIGTDVLSPADLPLGTVTDLIVNPTNGKIEYLVLTPGSLFEPGADLTPIPWQDFKATSTAHLLVLPSSATAIAAAPKVQIDQFTSPAGFDQQSRQVDLYWKKQERK